MRKIVSLLISYLLLFSPFAYAVTPTPHATGNSGQVIGTLKQATDAGVTVGPGDLYTEDAITAKGTLRTIGGLDVDEDVDVDFDANDEEFDIQTTSTSGTSRGVLRITNTQEAVGTQGYLLELWQKNQGASTLADFIIVKDSATARTLFTLSENGDIDTNGAIQTGTGNHVLTNAAGLIDGEKIQDDTIDDDSIDFADVTGADLTLTDCGTITASGNITAGAQYGSVGADGNTYYRVFISTELAPTEEYTLLSGGKAGTFTVHIGTFSVFGTHTSAAAVTLTTQSSPNTGTTNDVIDKVNAYDGGTAVIIENNSATTSQAWIEYFWQN